MAIIVTPGGSTSNSYATLVEADAYHDTRLHNTAWTSASDATKEAALIWATRTLDKNMCWNGQIASDTQALDWPRYGMVYKSGYFVDSDIVPQEVKDAESELAFLLIEDDRTTAADPNCGVQEAKAGPLSVKFDKNDRESSLSSSVMVLIQEFGDMYGAGKETISSVIQTVRV